MYVSEGQINESAESICSKPLTAKQLETLARIKARQDADDESNINYSDVPGVSDDQLARAVRPNRVCQFVGVRLDWDVLHWLKSYGPGHSTRINKILREVMEAHEA